MIYNHSLIFHVLFFHISLISLMFTTCYNKIKMYTYSDGDR